MTQNILWTSFDRQDEYKSIIILIIAMLNRASACTVLLCSLKVACSLGKLGCVPSYRQSAEGVVRGGRLLAIPFALVGSKSSSYNISLQSTLHNYFFSQIFPPVNLNSPSFRPCAPSNKPHHCHCLPAIPTQLKYFLPALHLPGIFHSSIVLTYTSTTWSLRPLWAFTSSTTPLHAPSGCPRPRLHHGRIPLQ